MLEFRKNICYCYLFLNKNEGVGSNKIPKNYPTNHKEGGYYTKTPGILAGSFVYVRYFHLLFFDDQLAVVMNMI